MFSRLFVLFLENDFLGWFKNEFADRRSKTAANSIKKTFKETERMACVQNTGIKCQEYVCCFAAIAWSTQPSYERKALEEFDDFDRNYV